MEIDSVQSLDFFDRYSSPFAFELKYETFISLFELLKTVSSSSFGFKCLNFAKSAKVLCLTLLIEHFNGFSIVKRSEIDQKLDENVRKRRFEGFS